MLSCNVILLYTWTRSNCLAEYDLHQQSNFNTDDHMVTSLCVSHGEDVTLRCLEGRESASSGGAHYVLEFVWSNLHVFTMGRKLVMV